MLGMTKIVLRQRVGIEDHMREHRLAAPQHLSAAPFGGAIGRAIAEQLGLLLSGGSDWHGAGDGPRTIGMMQVPMEWLTRQDERVEALRRVPAA